LNSLEPWVPTERYFPERSLDVTIDHLPTLLVTSTLSTHACQTRSAWNACEQANEFTRLLVCIYSKFMELGTRGLYRDKNSRIIIIELKG
jgi:hypothetical protein